MKFWRPFLVIMLGVAVWGLFHAVGAYFGGVDRAGGNFAQQDLRKFFVVAGFVLAFLAFWATMLIARKRRLEREADDAE